MNERVVFDADPTGLGDLRDNLNREVTRRWVSTARDIKRAVLMHDVLGIGDKAPQSMMPVADKATLFKRWLDERLMSGVAGYDGSWLEPHLEQASKRGVGRVAVGDAGHDDEPRDDHGRWTEGSGGGAEASGGFTADRRYDFNPDPSKPIGSEARDYVLQHGRATNSEYLVAINSGGQLVSVLGGDKHSVGFTREMDHAAANVGEEMVVHHNHPGGASLSGADISQLGKAGIAAIWAHGNNGISYRASLTPQARQKILDDKGVGIARLFGVYDLASTAISSTVKPILGAAKGGAQDSLINIADMNHAGWVNETLARAGIIDYRSGRDESKSAVAIAFGIDDALNAIAHKARSVFYGRDFSADDVAGRSTQPLRIAGDLGTPFKSVEEPARRNGAEGGNDRAGRKAVGDAQQGIDFLVSRRAPSAGACQAASVGHLATICEDVSSRAHDAVAGALMQKARPRQVAKLIDQAMGGGLRRTRQLGEHALTQSYSQATLDALEASGVTHVGTISEHRRKLKDFSPDEPRDDRGRWSGGGGFGSIAPEAFIAARNKSTRAGYMSPLEPSDIQAHTLFTNRDHTVGAAVDPSGDVQNVFNNGGPKGAGADAVVEAIRRGGRTLDAYAPYLPEFYHQLGFEETGRMKFNPAFAHNWDATQGQPDVVFMAWKGYGEGGEQAALARAKGPHDQWNANVQSGRIEDDYDAAKQRSREAALQRRGAVGDQDAGAQPWPQSDRAGSESGFGSGEGDWQYRLDDYARTTPQPQHPRTGQFAKAHVVAREARRSGRTGQFRRQGPTPEEQRLEELRQARFNRVKGKLDVLTQGDDRVCDECDGISDGGPYSIGEARSLIPAHPNCRCLFVAAGSMQDAWLDDFSPDQPRDETGKWTEGSGTVAYHGSSHDFEKFDKAFIGTGQGAQSYGRGLYFAEQPEVATSYRREGGNPFPGMTKGGNATYTMTQQESLDYARISASGGSIDKAIENLGTAIDQVKWALGKGSTASLSAQQQGSTKLARLQELQAMAKQYKAEGYEFKPASEGNLYTVKIHAKPEDMLDWDAPLSSQPKVVKDFVDSHIDKARLQGSSFSGGQLREPTGEDILHRISGGVVGANMMMAAGIKGIRYLDEQSRRRDASLPRTHNIVIFNPDDVEITHKNGKRVGMHDAEPDDAEDAAFRQEWLRLSLMALPPPRADLAEPSPVGDFDPDQARDPQGRWTALSGSEGHQGLISTRPVTASGTGAEAKVKASAARGVYKTIDFEAMKAAPDQFKANTALFKDGKFYPGMRADEVKGDTDHVADAVKDRMVDNLMFLANKVKAGDFGSKDDFKTWAGWYEGAHSLAEGNAKKYKTDIASSSGVLAALSPQNDWSMNVHQADVVSDSMANKQGMKWDKAMRDTAHAIWTGQRVDMAREIEGKTLAELDKPMEGDPEGAEGRALRLARKAMWIRTEDEAHSDRSYRTVLPNGSLGDVVTTKSGENATAAWKGVSSIANAVRAYESKGDFNQLSEAMGDRHKVRSFYNNILDPNSKNGDVTIDTHAVGAAWLTPSTQDDVSVYHALNTSPLAADKPEGFVASKGSAVTGVKGTYGFYAQAYREAAKQLHIQPRQLQSVVWEAKQRLFSKTATGKRVKVAVDAVWRRYHSGEIGLKAAQTEVVKAAQGSVG